MGRKLNALEELQASYADRAANREEGRAQLQEQLLERIADSLGIGVAKLSEPPPLSRTVQPPVDIGRQNELLLTQQCAELVKAFAQIQDPQDRLRCLEIVHAAALAKPRGSIG